jgi:hypothetical protein
LYRQKLEIWAVLENDLKTLLCSAENFELSFSTTWV